MTNRPTPPGRNGCVCPRCHAVFSSPTGFDRHQDQGATTTCHAPAERGLVVLRKHDGHPVWGLPVPEADRERVARLRQA